MQQQAFFHAYEYMKGHKLGVIKVHPIIAERLAQDPMFQTLQPRHLPMLVKPKPWLNHNVGGYLNSKSKPSSLLSCETF
jgi:DNA-directed RNA polymerase